MRTLVGQGFTDIGGTTTADAVSGLQSNAQSLTFGTETGTAYHVHKHMSELPSTERPPAGAGFEAELGAYVGGARRTIAEGTPSGTLDASGAGGLTFIREVVVNGTTYQMKALVYVREGMGVIASYQGKQL